MHKNTKNSLNTLRAPIMMLYILSFCSGRGNIAPWVVLAPVSIVVMYFYGFYFSWEKIKSLITENIRIKAIITGAVTAIVLYGLFKITLMTFSSMKLGEFGALGKSSLPEPFFTLLTIKNLTSNLPAFLVGLAGAIILIPAEEIFWRGFLLWNLPFKKPYPWGIFLQAVLYGGFYAVLISPFAGAAAAMCALVFAALTVSTKSLLPAMLSHGLLWLFTIWLTPLF